MESFTLTDDVIDSRTIDWRIAELNDLFDENGPTDNFGPEEHAEWGFLTQFRHDFHEENGWEDSEWEDGITFIHSDHFTEYAEEYVRECNHDTIGQMEESLPEWLKPHVTIDWDGVASDLKVDYSSIDFLGTSYFYRA